MNYFIVICVFAGGSLSAPVDDPVRVELPVYDKPDQAAPASSSAQLTEPLEAENHPGVMIRAETPVGHLLSHKLQAATSILGSKLHSNHEQQAIISSIFPAPVTTREDALLETEGWGSKTLSVKENVQHFVAGIFQPKPIVDTLKEEEKYGNTGDKFSGIGRAVVGGAEGVSNLINSVLEVPGNVFRKITRVASEKLNNLGGKLIGLNK